MHADWQVLPSNLQCEVCCIAKLLTRHWFCQQTCLILASWMQVLVIVAASHLDAVTFQICSQSFKIMPTALFAVWLLGQYLTPMQWASLPVLAVGVVLVTMNGSAGELLHYQLHNTA